MNGDSDELEIEIDEAGQVKVHVRGRPGPACLDYVEIFRTLLDGKVDAVEKTSEFYEADTSQSIRGNIGQRIAARLSRRG